MGDRDLVGRLGAADRCEPVTAPAAARLIEIKRLRYVARAARRDAFLSIATGLAALVGAL